MKKYEEWMKNEHDIYRNLCYKLEKKHKNGEICVDDMVKEQNKRGSGAPIYDVYNCMHNFDEGFPWDGDYEDMLGAITRESQFFGIEEVDSFLQVFRGSLILYDQYKLKKFRNKYSICILNCGIYGCFGDKEDFIFKNVRRDINNNKKYSNTELFKLKCKYERLYEEEFGYF